MRLTPFYKTFPHLNLAELAEHNHRESKHDDVASEHLPNVEEDSLETDVVEAAGGEDDNVEAVLAGFPEAKIHNKLLKVEAVLIGQLGGF